MAFALVQQVAYTPLTSEPSIGTSFAVSNAKDLLIVGYSSYDTATPTFSLADTGGNTWTPGPSTPEYVNYLSSGFFWAIAKAAGSTTITLTGTSTSHLAMIVSEFSYSSASGATILLPSGYGNVNTGSSQTPALGSIPYTGGANFLAYGTFCEALATGQVHSVGSGFALINSFTTSSGHHVGQLDEYQAVTSSSSPLTINAGWGTGTPWCGSGAVFVEAFPTLGRTQVASDRSLSRRRLWAD